MNDLLLGKLDNLDIKRMVGYRSLYRFRLGKIRIIFRIEKNIVEIVDVDFRGGIY